MNFKNIFTISFTPKLGRCNNGKTHILIMPIMHYKIITITIVIDIVVIYVCWLKLVGSEMITNVNRHKAYQQLTYSSKVAKRSPGEPIGA